MYLHYSSSKTVKYFHKWAQPIPLKPFPFHTPSVILIYVNYAPDEGTLITEQIHYTESDSRWVNQEILCFFMET